MRLNFKKVSAIATSALMVGMTMGTAVAANYPAPFVSGGAANVAVVYGTGAGVSSLDLVQAGNIQSNLQSYMTGSSSTSTSVSGEAIELYTGGTKLYISDAINKVRSGALGESEFPDLLNDGSFSGNVDATFTQQISVNSYPNVTYEAQPTNDDDPNIAIKLGTTTSTQAAFNLTVTFNKAINFSHADSEGEDITLFGKTFTVSSSTDNTNLVLLQSAEKVSLSTDTPSSDVTIGEKEYTVELVSASDTSATIKVTDKVAGTSESKEISEAQSKKINGITIAVTNADETNLKLSASVVAGSEKITFTDASEVKIGEDDSVIEGTLVDFTGTSDALTKLSVSVTVDDSDEDAIKSGESLIDPVFGAVKLGFSGLNIEEDSTSREDIIIAPNGNDKMQVTFTDDVNDVAKTIRYAYYKGGTNDSLMAEDYGNISVREMEKLHEGDYVVVGNEDTGRLYKITNVNNASSGDDIVTFVDQFSGGTISASFSAGVATSTVTLGGLSYAIALEGNSGITDSLYNVTLNYPDSSADNLVLYPTITTSKGAKLAFYEPTVINVTNWNGNGSSTTLVDGFLFPNGADTYQTIGTFARVNGTSITFDCAGTTKNMNGTYVGQTCAITNTGFTYNFSLTDVDTLTVHLLNAAATSPVTSPAIMVFEEKDDNSVYEGLIVTTESGATSEDGIGVDDVDRTWLNDALWDSLTVDSDNDLRKEIDLWGSLITTDVGDSDQVTATISYPDEQIYAMVYMGALDSDVTGGTTTAGTALGDVLVKDSEVSSVSSKNLIVVGGSCINTVAAKLLGGGACSADFTSKTGVGSGQFLIQSFGDAYTTGKIALLVAGYEAADTVNAATYLRTKTVDTTAGKKYKGTSATTAELVTTSE